MLCSERKLVWDISITRNAVCGKNCESCPERLWKAESSYCMRGKYRVCGHKACACVKINYLTLIYT